MRILVVAATTYEIEPFINFIEKQNTITSVEYLVTGIGIMYTSYALLKKILKTPYDLVINVGIAGSYTETLALGDVVRVNKDCFGDLGVLTKDDSLMNVFDLEWIKPKNPLYENGNLIETSMLNTDLVSVKGITVNTANGSKRSIQTIKNKYPEASVESMEGAAVFYTCIKENISCLQIRAISNYVEPRNKKNWKTSLAITNLNNWLIYFIKQRA